MTRRHQSNYDLLTDIEQLLTERPAIEHFTNDWDEGFPQGGNGTGRSIGSHSDRTAAAVIAPDTPCRECGHETPCPDHPRPGVDQIWSHREGEGMADQLRAVTLDLDAALVLIRRAAKSWRRLRPDDHTVAEMRARQRDTRSIGVGQCNIGGCDTWCTGGRDDRLKTGMCPRHYRAWRRNLEADQPLTLDEYRNQPVGDMGDNNPANNDGTDTPHDERADVPYGSIGSVSPSGDAA